jgi:hypothetical protein
MTAAASVDDDVGYKLRPVTPRDVPTLADSDWDLPELGPVIEEPVEPIATPPAPPRSRVAAGPARRPVAAPSRATAVPEPDGLPEPIAAVITALGNAMAGLKTMLTWIAGLVGVLAGRPMPGNALPLVVAYRTCFGLLGRWTAWVSETSYTVSFILITLAIASGMIGRHTLAAWLFRAIIALNLFGIAGDLISLVTLSFRKDPIRGTLFLVPPLTLYYLRSDWGRYRDTVLRMRIPLLTLGAVILASIFVPWLHGGSQAENRLAAAAKKAVDTVEERLTGSQDAIEVGLKQARSWLQELPMPQPSSVPDSPGSHHPPAGRKR